MQKVMLILLMVMLSLMAHTSEDKTEIICQDSFVGWDDEPMENEVWQDVVVTTYNPVKSQCDDTPLVTSCRAHIDTFALRDGELKWCAVSRDLLEVYSYGDTIEVFIDYGHRYNGRYKVMDTMNKRFTNRIDILTLTKGGKWNGQIK